MNMKDHILAALREQCDRWEALLAGLSEAQLAAPQNPSLWAMQEVITHLWAWQQITSARVEAALHGGEPIYPTWFPGGSGDGEGSVDQTNARIIATYRAQSWPQARRQWREGFDRLLALGAAIPERKLLGWGVYPQVGKWPLAFVLLATYDHHQEHLEKTLAWLGKG
jgi:hypothetical protein